MQALEKAGFMRRSANNNQDKDFSSGRGVLGKRLLLQLDVTPSSAGSSSACPSWELIPCENEAVPLPA